MAKVVADYGVVPEFRRSAEERVRRDHDTTREGSGAGGDVAREVVGRNLHVRRAEKPDADPRDIRMASVESPPRHERVLFSTVLPFTSKPLTGSLDPLASKNMPAQLSWIVFPAKKPR